MNMKENFTDDIHVTMHSLCAGVLHQRFRYRH